MARITVTLIQAAQDAIANVARRRGLSKTDTINRAVRAYDFIDEAMHSGKQVLLRDPETGETEIVRFV
jgi:hypothetical protein